MTISKFVSMAASENYYCYIYSYLLQDNIFEGMIEDIPEELLESELYSWEITDRIVMNIE